MTEPINTSPDYLERLALFVGETRPEDIPARVLDRARLILVDTLAVIAAGMRTPELTALSDAQIASASPGNAWVIGRGRRTNPIDAAMLNGVAGAWHDFDEGNTLANGHPGIQVLPTALALGQERRLHGREVLAAFALAYEVVARIGRATRVKLIVNPHGTFGVVGAALVAARLSGFPVERMRALASLAASTCMATNRHTMIDGATIRNWYAGHSSFMGQMALRLAQSGLTGPSDGVNTTFSLVLGDGFSPDVAVDGLGEQWMLPDGYLKLHPTARYAHSAIDAWFDALKKTERPPEPEDIVRIDVSAYRLAAFLAKQHPTDWFGTRFSIPFAIATLAVGGRSGLDAFGNDAVADPRIQDLCAKIHVIEDPSFTAEYPELQRVSLRMLLRDGSEIKGECHTTTGEPDRPIDGAALDQKFEELTRPIWGPSRARQLRDALHNIDHCADLSTLVDFNP
jgi:2-methylcitrate dehydratase PrpD